MANIGLAMNRQYQTRDGERREETTFVDCEAWGRQAEVMAQYLSKGRPVFIQGRLKLDTWQDQQGQNRSKLKVVVENFQFVGGREGGGAPGAGGGGRDYQPSSAPTVVAVAGMRPPQTTTFPSDRRIGGSDRSLLPPFSGRGEGPGRNDARFHEPPPFPEGAVLAYSSIRPCTCRSLGRWADPPLLTPWKRAPAQRTASNFMPAASNRQVTLLLNRNVESLGVGDVVKVRRATPATTCFLSASPRFRPRSGSNR